MGNLLNKPAAAAQAGGGRPPRRAAAPTAGLLNNDPAAGGAQADGALRAAPPVGGDLINNGQAAAAAGELHRSTICGAAAITAAFMVFIGTWSVLQTRWYTPELVAAMLVAMVNLFVGAWVATEGREHRTVAFVNLFLSFVPLAIALAHGAAFDPDLARNIFRAVKTILSLL